MSSAGLVALLNEKSCAEYALKALHEQVDQHWSELANHLPLLESMYLSNKVDQLALLISKIYFFLNVPDLSLQYALNASLYENSLFIQSIIQNAVTTFIASPSNKVDPLLTTMIDKIIADAFKNGHIDLVVSLAVQSTNLPLLKKCINESKDASVLDVIYTTILTINEFEFRNTVLKLIVSHFIKSNQFFSAVQCFVYLNDADGLSGLLNELTTSHPLIAYQIGFDLHNQASQSLLKAILTHIQNTHLESILTGTKSTMLYLEFMYRNNKGDVLLLTNINQHLDNRSSIHHTALSICNAFMFCGTTYDQFLRDNLEWLSRASYWSKFTATAALGVIHKGQVDSLKILDSYIPMDQVSTQPYSESGALYALGLIHVGTIPNHKITTLLNAHINSTDPVLSHGACLGLGLTLLASQHNESYEALKAVLYSDSSIAGQAAAVSIGLVMIGSHATTILNELMQYAKDTQHESIKRGISIGIALLLYNKGVEALDTIAILLNNPLPILRQAGCNALAMAFCGTSNNKAIQSLLHVAVSDVNDDVRRHSVIALGFVLYNNFQGALSTISLLINSYNPHVRYGSCIALGIIYHGTHHTEALTLLKPLVKDSVDFVRQGALIANGMLVMMHLHADYTTNMNKIIADKRESSIVKLGALMGFGIAEGGGRNCDLQLMNNNHLQMNAIVGVLIWTQYWYWYPYSLTLSMAITPSCFIGLNEALNIPKMQDGLICHASPSVYQYPPCLKPQKQTTISKTTAMLSVSIKTKERQLRRESELKTPISATADVEMTDVAVSPEKETQEPEEYLMSNMTRITQEQSKKVGVVENGKYKLVKGGHLMGIMMMELAGEGEEEVLELKAQLLSRAFEMTDSSKERPVPEDIENPFVMQE